MKQFIDPREYNQIFVNKQFHSYATQMSSYRYTKIENSKLMASKPTKGIIQGTVVRDLGSDLLVALHLLSSPVKSDDVKVIISKREFLTNNRI